MTANHEYAPTTFRGPDPTYVVSLKYAAGSRQVKMSPQDIEKAIESIIAAAEQRGAIKALRDAANLSRTCWAANKNLRDPDNPEAYYSFDRWLEVRADRLEGDDG